MAQHSIVLPSRLGMKKRIPFKVAAESNRNVFEERTANIESGKFGGRTERRYSMKILQDLSVFWAMFHVIFLFVMLFRSRYKKKTTILLSVVGMGVLMILNAVGLVVFGMDALGKAFLFTCSIPSFLFFYFLSADKRFRFLFTFCMADTACIWIMAVTNLLDHYVGGGQYVLLFVSRLIAFPFMEYMIYRYFRKPYLELQDAVEKGWGIFTGMAMLYYALLVIVVQYPTNIVNRPEDMLLCVLVLVLMVLNYGTIFSALYRQLMLYRKRQSEQNLEQQKRSLEAQLENQQRLYQMKHDMRGYMTMLSGLLEAGNTEEALAYMNQVETEMAVYSGQFCANPYINAIFSSYFQKFQELGTELRMDIQIGEETLPYMELCQILSNGLENAWDALQKLEEDRREVSVQMKYNKGYLVIRMKNRCQEKFHVEKGTIPATQKKGSGHGLGLPTIAEAAEQLGGDMLCYAENGYFYVDVIVSVKRL